MSNRDRTSTSYQQDVHLTGRLWAFDDGADVEDRTAYFATGLTNLGFIQAALRRSARLLCAIAVAGLLVGVGVFVKSPVSYQASTSVILPPGGLPGVVNDDQAIAQSRTVAGLAEHKLGLPQSATSLVGNYTVTVITNRVLLFTSKARSAADAVRESNALASAFLEFQADLLTTQEQFVNSALQQQVSQTQQQVDSINKQISQLSVQPASSAQLGRLRTERDQATGALAALQQATSANKANTQVVTDTALKGSRVLDEAALIPQHRTKRLVLCVGGGLLAGLAVGLGIIIVRALISERLRRRDEIAHALGAPVKLSVGAVRLSSWPFGRRRVTAARSPEVMRIVTFLRNAVPSSSHGPASLAVIPVDDVQVPAACLVSLAVAIAQQDTQVVMVDLCRGTPAARRLGVNVPGVQAVSVAGAELVVVVPEPDDVVPIGPLQPDQGQVSDQLSAACASADFLLTLAALDPSLGAEHLAGWTRGAVAMITAGQSTAERIHAVGEMIRLAGMRLISGVLVGADKTDQSLGMTHVASGTGEDVREGDLYPGAEGFLAVDGRPHKRLSADR